MTKPPSIPTRPNGGRQGETMMRRMLVLGAVAVVALLTACEPTMTITAKQDGLPIAGTTSYVSGKVTPANATPQVVLQRTVGGKWVDWKSCQASEDCSPGSGIPTRVPKANVNQTSGAYSILYPVQWCGVVLHLRVRSSGGTAFSPGFYTQADPNESC